MGFYLKAPAASIDYAVDWGAGYLAGETLAASSWHILPEETGGLSVAAESLDGARAAATLSGGIAGHVYRVTNRATFSDGREDERSIAVRVDAR